MKNGSMTRNACYILGSGLIVIAVLVAFRLASTLDRGAVLTIAAVSALAYYYLSPLPITDDDFITVSDEL